MSNPFNVGDVVRRTHGNYNGMKAGDTGTIVNVSSSGVKLNRYKGKDDGRHSVRSLELVSKARQTTTIPVQSYAAQYSKPLHPTAKIDDSDDAMSYEDRKAAAPVCSVGKFSAGSKLRYCDGTIIPNGEARTVLRCTATCVWFEETYSMPFNPNEFEVDY